MTLPLKRNKRMRGIVESIQKQTGLSMVAIKAVVEAYEGYIHQCLLNGEDFTIEEIGILRLYDRKPRVQFSPFDNECHALQNIAQLKFTPSKNIKQELINNSEQILKVVTARDQKRRRRANNKEKP